MPLTRKWDQRPLAAGRAPTATVPVDRSGPLPETKKATIVPTRGYRKGTSDRLEPATRSIRTHITERAFAVLAEECAARSMTKSKLVRALIAAHVRGQRAELPHPRSANAEALRELCRAGNNLNQLAKQANVGLVAVGADELRAVLAAVLDAVRRLA
jgi:Bacterial mobilisation protein (MobC)